MSADTGTDTSAAPVNRVVGASFGALWVAGGVLSLVAARALPFATKTGHELTGKLSVNGLHGALMVLLGVALLGAAVIGGVVSRRTNLVVGVVWVVLDVYALLTGTSSQNVLAINDHDADLLLVAALGLLVTALLLDLPGTAGHGPEYRKVRHGQGPNVVDAADVERARSGGR